MSMGREVRKVPADWNHPRNAAGHLIPLYGESFAARLAQWDEGKEKWEEGLRRDFRERNVWKPRDRDEDCSYEKWDGPRPEAQDYMPDWKPDECTHFQMYETCTEGTPISPVKETPEELARWLAANGASAFGTQTASYEAWLSTIRRGSACAAMVSPETGLISGVEANRRMSDQCQE
jgi:hypothetical protein